MSIEAMKQALEAMNAMMTHMGMDEDEWNKVTFDQMRKAIASLRQAIAKAEKQVTYTGNGTAGRENMTAPTGFFFEMPKAEKQEHEFVCGKCVKCGISIENQEPVAFRCGDAIVHIKPPVYGNTHPQPKREWIGLTDEEIKEIVGPWGDTPIKGYTRQLFDKIEAKLKEKNT
jgi:hypothetical protein